MMLIWRHFCQNLHKTTAMKGLLKALVLMTACCNQRINSRYSATAADSRRCHLVMSLCLAMSYCSVLSSATQLTKIDVLCLGTLRRCGHNMLLNWNQAKIFKALTCCLCHKVHPRLLGSLRRSKGGFETTVSDWNYRSESWKTVSLSNLTSKMIVILFDARHSFDRSLMQIVILP